MNQKRNIVFKQKIKIKAVTIINKMVKKYISFIWEQKQRANEIHKLKK